MRAALLDALALVLPVDCAGCGRADRALCTACRRALTPVIRREILGALPPLYVAARYEGPLRGVLLAFKGGRTGLVRDLAPMLAAAIARAVSDAEPGVELCAVPSSGAAYRRRGFDPVRMLVRATGRDSARVLRRAARHPDQKALGRRQRLQNLAGVYRARSRLDGRSFIIIDDIVTSGATLAAVSTAIRDAGGRLVAVVALAATPRTGSARRPHGRHPGARG